MASSKDMPLRSNCVDEAMDDFCFTSGDIWSIIFSLESEKIIATFTRKLNKSFVTHALKVEGLWGIITIPAKLESTSLVFAYGIHLFYTQLAPSRTYDSLTEDFSYALLLITIIALVAAIFAMWILSERKELQEKWR